MAASLVLLAAWSVISGRTEGTGPVDRPASLWHMVVPGLVVAIAMLVGIWFSKAGGWSIPPAQSTDWFAAALELGAAAVIATAAIRTQTVALGSRVVVAVVLCSGLAWKQARSSWPLGESIATIGSFTLLTVLAWAALDRLCVPRHGTLGATDASHRLHGAPAWSGPAVLLCWTGLASQALAATDSILLGKVLAMQAAVMGVALVLSLVRKNSDFMSGVPAVVSLMMCVLVYSGLHYAGLRVWMAVLIGIAPAFATGVDLLLLRSLTGTPRGLARVGAVSVLPAIVLAVAIPAALKAAEGSDGY